VAGRRNPLLRSSWRGARNLMEHEFTCPYCGEKISMVLDLSVSRQSYVEDCEVCCRPMEVSYALEDDALVEFSARSIEQ
jgi:transcription elongation factor Elf1